MGEIVCRVSERQYDVCPYSPYCHTHIKDISLIASWTT